ncbi:predicted protein, partial [Postia placenta Mad-698-R]
LTTASMQNQFHELAKTLPPPRKQNTACDACRFVFPFLLPFPRDRCSLPLQGAQSQVQPAPRTGQGSVLSTLHHVQQATTEKKRNANLNKRPRTLSTSAPGGTGDQSISPGHTPTTPNYPAAASYRPLQGYWPHYNPITLQTSTRDLLAYLFSPPTPSTMQGYNAALPPGMGGSYADWGDVAAKLGDESFRIDIALDLVDVYFQIVHTRLPLLNPAQFRTRLQRGLFLGANSRSHSPHTPPSAPASTDGLKPLHPALVATVIAWGAKFSENPLLVADRARNANQSQLAKTLINRARDLAEDLKVHRIPSADHVVIALLIEPMQSRACASACRFHGFWLMSAIRLLLDLQINHKSVMSNIQDPEARGTMIFAWWMACLADAYRSVYYRRKPMLDDDDYDIDFYTVGPVPPDHLEPQGQQPSPREQLEFLGYYRAAHALARISRQMSRQLWRPATESDGIPLGELVTFMALLNEWREEHLQVVGVPSNFHSDWDFVSAVTACASDATYHIMWIILFNALDDFGIREVNDLTRTGSPGNILPNTAHIENTKRKVMDEALHGATRIAGL